MKKSITKFLAGLFVFALFIGLSFLLVIKAPVMWSLLTQIIAVAVSIAAIVWLLRGLFDDEEEV